MAAVAGASPVTITVRTPSPCNSLTSAAESVARRVAERDEPDQLHRRRRSGRDRQHSEALSFKFVRRRCRGRRRLGEADDRRQRRPSRRVACRRSRPLPSPRTSSSPDRTATNLISFGASEMALPAAAARMAPSTGSCPPSELASAASARTCASSKPGMGRTVVTVSALLRQRAGLVGAQDIHRRRFIHRGEAGRKNAQLCQGPRAERRREGEGGRQRDRYRCENRRQDEGDDLGERHLEKTGIGHQHHDDDAVERGEIAHHAQNRLLLGAYDMRGADEFRGAAELGARPGRRDLRHRLAAPDQRPRDRSERPRRLRSEPIRR